MTSKPYILFRYNTEEDKMLLDRAKESVSKMMSSSLTQHVNVTLPTLGCKYIIVTLEDEIYTISLSTNDMVYTDDDVRANMEEEDFMDEDIINDNIREIIICLWSDYIESD